MTIPDRFRLLRKRERIFLSIMKQKLYFETFFPLLLLMVLVGCAPVPEPSPTPTPPPSVEVYEEGKFPWWLHKLCDAEEGNLIYFSAYHPDGGVAVVPNGCPKTKEK